jgi:hypothetical protein
MQKQLRRKVLGDKWWSEVAKRRNKDFRSSNIYQILAEVRMAFSTYLRIGSVECLPAIYMVMPTLFCTRFRTDERRQFSGGF